MDDIVFLVFESAFSENGTSIESVRSGAGESGDAEGNGIAKGSGSTMGISILIGLDIFVVADRIFVLANANDTIFDAYHVCQDDTCPAKVYRDGGAGFGSEGDSQGNFFCFLDAFPGEGSVRGTGSCDLDSGAFLVLEACGCQPGHPPNNDAASLSVPDFWRG